MTYRELMNLLMEMDNNTLDNMDVTVYDTYEEEYYPVRHIKFTSSEDILDINHPYLTI